MVAFILPANSVRDTGYDIDNSLRFEESSNEYLYWLPTSNPTGGGQTFTFSFWYKPTASYATNQTIFGNADDDSDTRYGQIRHRTGASGALEFSFGDNNDGGWKFDLETSALLRDPSAWYHIICQSDTTNSTEGDRIKIYINGERVTSFGTENYPAQNYVSDFGANDIEQTVGGTRDTDGNFSAPFSGYLSDVYFIDGQALTPTSFGETNDNGVWIPKKFSGSYGTNGYKLEFQQTGTSANSSGMGADTSGNDHHFTVVALDATSVTTDTPTNNFCTMNPLHNQHANSTFSEGNLQVATTVAQFTSNTGTMGVSSGKWYYECKNIGAGASNQHRFGFDAQMATGNNQSPGLLNPSIAYKFEGNYALNGSNITDSDYSATSVGDIVGVAIDVDNNKFWVRNSSGYFDGDPAAGSGGIDISAPTANNGIGFYLPSYGDQHDGEGGFIGGFNFGNPFFAISSGNADGNGYGNFEFAVPSGYYALCTKNLAEFG
jgi:hypothetical protein